MANQRKGTIMGSLSCIGRRNRALVLFAFIASLCLGALSVHAARRYLLTVSVSGSGSVSSAPAGISCGTDCSEEYTRGTSVTLTATPALGQHLESWGGHCSGSSITCTVSMTRARSVLATFALDPPADTEPPTTPGNLTAQAVAATRIDLSWTASTDNVGVHHYEVSRGVGVIASTTDLRHSDITVSPSTTYTFTVRAVDAAGNASAPSNAATASTPPSDGWPLTPPVQVCDNPDLLTGPPAPPDALIVPAGDNSTFNFNQPGAVFWFAPGVHTLGSHEFSQIIPAAQTTFIGGPGAILDGQRINRYAFTQRSANVAIRYLTIRNFVAPLDEGVVNHDAGDGWTIEHNTIENNEGAGLMAGPNNRYSYNCIRNNGQYGINACCGTETSEIENFTLDRNEIAGNNTGDWENVRPGCGCTGGVKFWINNNVTVTNNYVHHNHGPGLWLDNNNRRFVIEHNYIADNDGQALFIEAGYDARVRYNNFRNNAVVTGREFQSRQDPFPIAAVYVSENGSPAGYGLTTTPMVISHNNFDNNWGGVALWENADRYCSSSAHTHPPHCTIKVDLYDDGPCETAVANDIPDTIDKYLCRWSTENVVVEHNVFRIDKTAIGAGCAGANYCGINGIFSNYGSFHEFPGYEIPWRLTFLQDNLFRNNRYLGDWHFAGFQTTVPDGSRVTWQNWIAPAPPIPPEYTHDNRPETFGQDQGSTFEPDPDPSAVARRGGQPRSEHRAPPRGARSARAAASEAKDELNANAKRRE
jgi:Divergent InlB B-repeat domain/Right handed beta helix region